MVGESQYHGKEYQSSSALDYGDSNDNVHTYVKQGDVNLGAVFSIHKYDKVRKTRFNINYCSCHYLRSIFPTNINQQISTIINPRKKISFFLGDPPTKRILLIQ